MKCMFANNVGINTISGVIANAVKQSINGERLVFPHRNDALIKPCRISTNSIMKRLCMIILALIGGCKSNPVEVPEKKLPEVAVTAPLRTGALQYQWTRVDSIVRSVDIPFSFTNISTDTLYIINCNGAYSPVLEKMTDSGWETFLFPASNACLSPPIIIAPRAVLRDTFYTMGALPGYNAGPEFRSDKIEGKYRLVLYNLVWHYDPSRENFGDTVPIQFRISDPFLIKE